MKPKGSPIFVKLGGVTKYTGNAAVIGDARIPVSQVYHCLEGVESEKHRPASKHPGFGVLSSGLPLVARGEIPRRLNGWPLLFRLPEMSDAELDPSEVCDLEIDQYEIARPKIVMVLLVDLMTIDAASEQNPLFGNSKQPVASPLFPSAS